MGSDGEGVREHDGDDDADEDREPERRDGHRVKLTEGAPRGIIHGQGVDGGRHREAESRDARKNSESRERRERRDGNPAGERCGS